MFKICRFLYCFHVGLNLQAHSSNPLLIGRVAAPNAIAFTYAGQILVRLKERAATRECYGRRRRNNPVFSPTVRKSLLAFNVVVIGLYVALLGKGEVRRSFWAKMILS